MKVAAAKIDGYDAAHDWVANFNRAAGVRIWMAAGKERGDTKLAAAKIIELISVDPDRKLSLRLALGDDAHDNARLFYMKRLEALEARKAESTGTDAAW
ncbi:hypothetical protein C8R43DRAFT_1136907 [Mycena crocata]|nr:hypothetical protein C8R43DRAFT_1136907 [Mycena crocata]